MRFDLILYFLYRRKTEGVRKLWVTLYMSYFSVFFFNLYFPKLFDFSGWLGRFNVIIGYGHPKPYSCPDPAYILRIALHTHPYLAQLSHKVMSNKNTLGAVSKYSCCSLFCLEKTLQTVHIAWST